MQTATGSFYIERLDGMNNREKPYAKPNPDSRYPIAESPRSGVIAAETAGMIGGLLVERVGKEGGIHPDAIHAKMAYIALRSVVADGEDQNRLRAAPVEELMERPVSFQVTDPSIPGEDAHKGGIYVKAPLGAEQYAELSTMYVDEAYRGHGDSARLIRAASTYALMAGWTPFAYAANKHAQAAFDHAGFTPAVNEEMPVMPYNESAQAYVLAPDSEATDHLIRRYVDSTSFETPEQRAQTLAHFGLDEEQLQE